MQQLSMIKAELLDQYVRFRHSIDVYNDKIQNEYLKGYVSKKVIRNRDYHYLQWRENGKLVSKYIKPEHVTTVKNNINERKRLERIVKEMRGSIKEIESFLGKREINKYLSEEVIS
ncbi:MAG: hypothetical protein IJ075_00460 [Lachnospiraceae bacterium]|nr:hypothetical protein [Lachnospiraceae bacterium]MBQ9605635.1 hypothetical protein [Lachnospiraceae bacterium]MBR1523106.1 hypothetical protein [Lachnospiraceae bacterium]